MSQEKFETFEKIHFSVIDCELQYGRTPNDMGGGAKGSQLYSKEDLRVYASNKHLF